MPPTLAAARPRITLAPGSGIPTVNVETEADIDAAIVLSEQAGAHHRAYLLRQRKANRIAYYEAFRDTAATTFKRVVAATRHAPTLLLFGADDGLHDGPEAWPIAERAIRWASAVILHGAGAELRHYQIAVEGAIIHRRLLLVECEFAALPPWEGLVLPQLYRLAVLKIVPTGGVHPVPGDRGILQ